MSQICAATREAVQELMDPGGCPLCGQSAQAHESENIVPDYYDSPDGLADLADQKRWDASDG